MSKKGDKVEQSRFDVVLKIFRGAWRCWTCWTWRGLRVGIAVGGCAGEPGALSSHTCEHEGEATRSYAARPRSVSSSHVSSRAVSSLWQPGIRSRRNCYRQVFRGNMPIEDLDAPLDIRLGYKTRRLGYIRRCRRLLCENLWVESTHTKGAPWIFSLRTSAEKLELWSNTTNACANTGSFFLHTSKHCQSETLHRSSGWTR